MSSWIAAQSVFFFWKCFVKSHWFIIKGLQLIFHIKGCSIINIYFIQKNVYRNIGTRNTSHSSNYLSEWMYLFTHCASVTSLRFVHGASMMNSQIFSICFLVYSISPYILYLWLLGTKELINLDSAQPQPRITFSDNSSNVVHTFTNETAIIFLKLDIEDERLQDVLPIKFEW